ncbi:S-adenosyl-L-methionine-dependent methyltransferase [Aspergillus pseudoustus]|uniref:S-adenosyl-L-methionine-dependent methyltransferase n=1 Tax=Aspergillus pseudoustus TaxID=1810923 RepID=A0ABR4JM71_9EURO
MTSSNNYVLARDLNGSLRLDCQHNLFRMYNGYVLHPAIPIHPDLKVAEIGTGTGIWLLELASQLPSTVLLDGFDISDRLFPHSSLLPSNLKLGVMDSFGDVPADLVGKYDVVHLRLWCCVVTGGDPSRLIRSAMGLLKPGGYLQWDEADPRKPFNKGEQAETFLPVALSIYETFNLDFSWIGDLDKHARNEGLQVVEFELGSFPTTLLPLVTKTHLSAHAELITSAYAGQSTSAVLPPREDAENRLFRLVEATKDGAVYHWSPVSLLAQKLT